MRQRVGRSEAEEDTAGSVKVEGGVKERERERWDERRKKEDGARAVNRESSDLAALVFRDCPEENP